MNTKFFSLIFVASGCETQTRNGHNPRDYLSVNFTTGPEIPINSMLKSQARGTYGCYESQAVTNEWLPL